MYNHSSLCLPHLSRRQFVLGASAALASAQVLAQPHLRVSSATANAVPVLTGPNIDLTIGHHEVNFTGSPRLATTVNNSLPAPTLRFREGQRAVIRVTNRLAQVSSIHWHGILLPSQMDGVPGLSFEGIAPGETFTYEFDLVQSGTYWYHSHSGFQEQTGLYGALIVESRDAEPVQADREHVLVLSDWTDEDPHNVYAKLKKASHYYNFSERTLGDWWRDVRSKGLVATWRDRQMWNQMRMSDTDIADVTGATYTYLMNGATPEQGWTALFQPGEKVRLRVINASAMTIFDLRIPGLKMTVVAADGQNVQPVTVDEFRIGIAETYDVVVEPQAGEAYTVFAQSIDRTGYTWGNLTNNPAIAAEIPAMDPAPVLRHADMGMAHGDGHQGHGGAGSGEGQGRGHEHAGHNDHADNMHHPSMGRSDMDHGTSNPAVGPHDHSSHAGHGSTDHGQHRMDAQPVVDHSAHDHAAHTPKAPGPVQGEDHASHGHGGHGLATVAVRHTNLGPAGFGSTAPIEHVRTEFGPHVDMRADAPVDGIDDPGIGLREHPLRYGRRVLTYADLKNLYPTADQRQPEREIQIHLTGNMGRYMWSMNGVNHADAAPIELRYGERVRFLLVNDTMMTHPIHLHGLWSELETGDPGYIPKKHTVLVQPGSKVSYLVTADARGRWAYHCHLLFHMPGMMREVRVV